MKKNHWTAAVFSSAALALAFTANTASADTCTTRTLVAGQNIPVGTVEVCPDADTVKYTITDPSYCLTEVHLAVGQALADIPQTKNEDPQPGQFPYSDSPDCTTAYTFNVPVEPEDYVAAHAVVQAGEDQETAWAGEYHFHGANWANYTIIPATTPPAMATCSQCEGVNCILQSPDATVSACGAGQDVCTITVSDPAPGREITRACDTRANAQALAAANGPGCKNIENHIVAPGVTCVSACDGVASPGCNKPPTLTLIDAVLFPF